jgi:glycosyltransferase involved in cell wall biosynthesis
MNECPTFSIIIPHKNTSDLLQRCLNSIPRREDIQIIVVDDNSDPDRVDFEHFPGLGDPYIEAIFTKEGKGAGYARNVGLEMAKGKWLLFADADDFFTENAFKHLFSYVDSSCDIIFFKTMSCYSDTYEPANRGIRYNQFVDDFIKKKNNSEIQIRFFWNVCWSKMIRSKIVTTSNIYFDEIIAGNDVMFSALTGFYAISINAIDITIYSVTVRRGSLIHVHNTEIEVIRYIVLLRRNEFFRKINKKNMQESLLKDLLKILKYGIRPFFQCIKLTIKYHNNLFINIDLLNWFKTYFINYKKRIKDRLYITKDYKGQ